MRLISKLGISVLIFACNFFTSVRYISSVDNTPVPLVYAQEKKEWTTEDTLRLISTKAKEYEVSEQTMIAIVRCETAGQMASTTIQSGHYLNGVREKSYGLTQINLPSWPDITYEQATDPQFALDFLARQLKANKGYLWSCYRMI